MTKELVDLADLVGRRVVLAGLLLGVLIALEIASPVLLSLVASAILLVTVVLTWTSAVFFVRKALFDARRAKKDGIPPILSLRARAQDAVALALGHSAGALLGGLVIGRALGVVPPVDRSVFLVGLAFALSMLAAPALNWLLLWRPWRV
jgi:hypothetical protein